MKRKSNMAPPMFKCPKCKKSKKFSRIYSAWVEVDGYGEIIGKTELHGALSHCEFQCLECDHVDAEERFIRVAQGA